MNTQLARAAEHLQYHHKGADGFVTIARVDKNAPRGWTERNYRPDEASAILSEWIGEDVYFSQNTFHKPQRRVENVKQLMALYVDVDFYTITGVDAAWTIGEMERVLFGKVVPYPNFIIHSGRGFVVKWLLEPAHHSELALWQTIERHFAKQFKKLGADMKATDAARVFRVPGSTNSKNGAEVTVHYCHDCRYNLHQLQAHYLPALTPKPKHERKNGRPAEVIRIHRERQLHLDRLNDLLKLTELRAYALTGYRELFCFLYRYWSCCYLHDEEEALRHAVELNAEFTEPLSESEVINATKSAEEAYRQRYDTEANKAARANGYPAAGYNYTNESLIAMFEITSEEQRHMKTIIGKEESRRRNTEARRAARNGGSMEEYKGKRSKAVADKLERLQAILEANPKATQRKLAEVLGVSQTLVHRLLKIL